MNFNKIKTAVTKFCKKWWKELLFGLAFLATFLFKKGPLVIQPKDDGSKADAQVHGAEERIRAQAAAQAAQEAAQAADRPTADAAGKLDAKERELADRSEPASRDADAANQWADQVSRRKP